MSDQETREEVPIFQITMAEFLENIPPNQPKIISDLVEENVWLGKDSWNCLRVPELQLYCTHESCNGLRFFRCVTSRQKIIEDQTYNTFITYRCSNCQNTSKIFSLFYYWPEGKKDECPCYKYGENPSFGPLISPQLISLISPDREIFLKGRRCENQGLGISSYGYYRRVVENQKNRMLEKIIKVAETLKAPENIITELNEALAETQFSKSMEIIKSELPESLLINGNNPLVLLNKALSLGISDLSDEECLEYARAIRIVLAELSEKLAQALKDDAEVNQAINKLLNIKK